MAKMTYSSGHWPVVIGVTTAETGNGWNYRGAFRCMVRTLTQTRAQNRLCGYRMVSTAARFGATLPHVDSR